MTLPIAMKSSVKEERILFRLPSTEHNAKVSGVELDLEAL